MAEPDEKSPLVKRRNSSEDEEELTGCGASAACDPRRALHRFLVLWLICFLSFGSYFCYDNPAALQSQIKKDMHVNTGTFMTLYSWYSWPNVILCFFGGFLLDRVFGIRLGTIIFSLFVLAGQCVFALGAQLNLFWLMEAGRFIFGIGGESLAVAQNTYAVTWFRGKELNMVFGLQLSFSRVGSTVNMNVMSPVYKWISGYVGEGYITLGYALWVGAGTCVLSLLCGLLLGYYDKRAARILKRDAGKTGEVIRITDVKDFPATFWLITVICVAYYVAVFPFIGLGLVFFEEKFDLNPTSANAVNSLVYIISAGASPVLGFLVDKTGKNVFWVILAILVTLACHMMLAFTFWNPYIAMSIMGVSYSLLACALWPIVAFIIPENQLGTAYGFMQSIQNLGLAVISIVAGSIVDQKGYLLLEVFFLAWLCLALIAGVVLYLVDAVRGGALNMSTWERDAQEEAEEKAKAAEQDERVRFKPRSAFALRNRFYSRIGAKLPDHFDIHTSSFFRRGVTQ
ncbi:major facilitator superfamily domain-containing protein 1-like [Branchiostoma floridae]|uniref:Lysosomal dipeptide transporter MFSD1 n=1 Tax=Branchiostoma floridae TaxID=7739 RepID=A0A9J7N800_BRAFL|nr:major facilitator superfamily domain-containing protein 1-like [Branchiostoma floridae]